jgi:folate-binding protein YgfZ
MEGAKAVDWPTLENWRIQALRPRVGIEIDDSTMPLEVGLIDAVSQGKGCYPGQEVIERIISMGTPPRRLAKLEGTWAPPHTPAAGDLVFSQDTECGKVTSIQLEDNRFTALVLLRKAQAKEGAPLKIRLTHNSNEVDAQIVQLTAYAP